MRLLLTLALMLALSCGGGTVHSRHSRHRSARAKAQFKLMYPCPATGAVKGPCPGYVIDHIVPLACNGPDEPTNMQWQTVEEGKAKDKWERKGCETVLR